MLGYGWCSFVTFTSLLEAKQAIRYCHISKIKKKEIFNMMDLEIIRDKQSYVIFISVFYVLTT